METDGSRFDLVESKPTHAIIGAAFEVLNELGHGLREKTYENALIVELNLRRTEYLRITKLRIGLVINFHKPKLEWERIVL